MDVPAEQWQKLFADPYPFTQHAFLAALETSGCVQEATGWQPNHILITENDQLLAAMPYYLKTHSYGEYVFDWAWADAYHQHGLNYYPKLLAAIPFTPSSGPRLAFAADIRSDAEKLNIIHFIERAIRDKYNQSTLSGWHLLFPNSALSDLLQRAGWKQRKGIQYHWFNKQYPSFDDFLETFKSRKRKLVRKERCAVADQGLLLTVRSGQEIDDALMTEFYRFYHLTYLKRSGQHGYLNLKFFRLLLTTMAQNLVMICATKSDTIVAAALCFKDDTSLYGRYWGCQQEYPFLHFEVCYYQGIEYCINNGLQHFDPGAQGEHKIARGFKPVTTLSNHVILHPEFKHAIEHFIAQESNQIDAHLNHLNTLLPYKTEPL